MSLSYFQFKSEAVSRPHVRIVGLRVPDEDEVDELQRNRIFFDLDDEFLFQVGVVGPGHGHEPLTVESHSAFRTILQFVP